MTRRPLPLVYWFAFYGVTTGALSLGMQAAGVPDWLRMGASMVAGFLFGRALAREAIRRARERDA